MKDKIYFRSISLKNVRCFGSEQTLYFTNNNQSDGEISMWNVILGENGVGKTTILRTLASINALHVNTSYYQSFYQNLVRKHTPLIPNIVSVSIVPKVKAFYSDSNYSSYVMDNGYFKYSGKIFSSNVIFGYGATRKIGSTSNSEEKTPNDRSLFDETTELSSPEKWLIQADYLALKNKNEKQYRLVANAIKKLISEEIEDFEIRTENNTAIVVFKTHYGWVRLQELSLGYKTLLSWIVDLAKGLVEQYPESEDPLSEPAICLVDEIDLHMHPKIQRSVVKFLRKTFPQTQFIVTAHSPLIVQSEEDTNVILLRRKDNEVEVVNDMDYVTNWRIDQILTSDLFGVSAYSPAIETTLNKRREIMVKDNPTEAEKKILSEMDNSAENLSIVESPEYIQTVKLIERLRSHAKS